MPPGEPAVTASNAASGPGAGAPRWVELAVLAGLLLLAAVTRLPSIAARGTWDADQGHDMLVLHALVAQGQVPLLGPPTSIGTFHHGALYYYVLAPAAFLSGADPVAVVMEIALLGIGAVAATWWLARLVGGPLAGAVAGLLAAVSPAGIDESTFIWNPNIVPLFAALAFGGAIRARQTGRLRWWVLAGAAASVAVQAHVLDTTLLLPLAILWLDTLRRRHRAGQPVRVELRGGVVMVALLALGYVPLLLSELGSGFAEVRAVLAYLGGGGRGPSGSLTLRLVVVLLRAITWPLTGLVTDRPAVALVAASIMAGLVQLAIMGRRAGDAAASATRADIPASRWLVATFGISVVVLAVFAPTLATVTPGLPNDHYHAFLDPVVMALAGIGGARLVGGLDALRGTVAWWVSRLMGVGILGAMAALCVAAWPPAAAVDGGWPGVDAAAAHVLELTGSAPVDLVGLPDFKSSDALGFPLVARDAPLGATAPTPAAFTVVVCDPLFDEVAGAACGGPAEDRWLAAAHPGGLPLVERWQAGPRRTISVYAAQEPGSGG